jgi:hypothetical protein
VNARTVAVLAVLLAALGGGALLVQQQAQTQKPATAGLGQPLFPGLQAAAVTAVAIREPPGAITIENRDGRWVIAERGGFPADYDKVRDFVLKAISLKVGQSEPIGEKDRARLKLDAGGTRIEFRGADGKPLAALTAGSKYFKTQPENPERALGDGRYVALPGDQGRVIVIADPLAQASTRSADWIGKAGWEVEKVRALELRAADGGGWRIERSGDNADWKLAGARGDEKLEVTKANAAAYTFGRIEVADVAPKELKAEDAGLDKPTVVTAATFDGLTYTLKAGKLEGENRYASLAIAGEPRPEGKDAEQRLKKIGERLPREKALAQYVVLVQKARLEDFLKPRAELLEKKDDKKK